MDTKEILQRIQGNQKKTPVKIYIQGNLSQVDFGSEAQVIRLGEGGIVFGNWDELEPILAKHASFIEHYVVEADRRNSTIDLLDYKSIDARIEPGAVIREGVTIEKDAVIMMGACLNIGAKIGTKTLVDMNAVIGGRAMIGSGCHIGAGTVIKGVISSPHANPVTIEDDVVIGPNAVILEGIHIGKGAVIAPGCIITKNVNPGEIIRSPFH